MDGSIILSNTEAEIVQIHLEGYKADGVSANFDRLTASVLDRLKQRKSTKPKARNHGGTHFEVACPGCEE